MLVEWALQYAARGWLIAPLWPLVEQDGILVCSCPRGAACKKSSGKHPWIKTGRKHQQGGSTDPAVIERWWKAKPESGIGIITGQRSGLAVIDVDSQAAAELLGKLGAPSTLTAATGRGMHLYYSIDKPCISNTGEGLDIRGDGGLVVAPPSLHYSGARYAWLEGTGTLAPLPEALRQWFTQRHGLKAGKQLEGSSKAAGKLLESSSKAVPAHIRARVRPRKLASSVQDTPRLDDVAACLEAIDNSGDGLPWDQWKKIGMAVWAATEGSDEGLELFDAFSRKAEKWKDDEGASRAWRELHTSPPKEIGFASLIWLAREAQPGFVLPSEKAAAAVAATIPDNKQQLATNSVNGSGGNARPFSTAKGGAIKETCSNARIAITNMGLDCKYDVFHQRFYIAGQELGQWAGDVTDELVHVLRILIGKQYGFDPGSQHAFDAAVQEALQNTYHPVRDYLAGLEWDRRPRLHAWLCDYMQAEDKPFISEAGKLMLCAAVRRIRQPGAKFDQIVVLEGPEGRGKSLALETLAGRENFSDHAILTLDDRQQQEEVRGVWLYEISELSGIRKADIDRVKAFASRTVDRARPAWGRKRVDQPRTCIFVGTTNERSYLQSMTGNRRFWPIPTGRIDLDAIARDRDQLWAEAAFLEAKGIGIGLHESYWGAAREIQESRRDTDPWEDILSGIENSAEVYPTAGGSEYRITTDSLLGGYLGIPEAQQTMVHAKRLGAVMRILGWDGSKNIRVNVVKNSDITRRSKGYTKQLST